MFSPELSLTAITLKSFRFSPPEKIKLDADIVHGFKCLKSCKTCRWSRLVFQSFYAHLTTGFLHSDFNARVLSIADLRPLIRHWNLKTLAIGVVIVYYMDDVAILKLIQILSSFPKLQLGTEQ